MFFVFGRAVVTALGMTERRGGETISEKTGGLRISRRLTPQKLNGVVTDAPTIPE